MVVMDWISIGASINRDPNACLGLWCLDPGRFSDGNQPAAKKCTVARKDNSGALDLGGLPVLERLDPSRARAARTTGQSHFLC